MVGIMADVSRAELKYLVERQREEIRTLHEAGRLLGSATDPKEIIALVGSYLHRTFPVALCGILVLERKKLYLTPFAPLAEVERLTAVRKIREAASEVLRRTIKEDESVPVAEDASGPANALLQATTPLRSHVFAPLTVDGQLTGLLGLFSGQHQAFSKEDQDAIGIVAEQLGAALRNALLVDELRRADTLKNEMLSIVSHELSTPLTAIKEGVNLILDGALGETTSDQRDFLQTVSDNVDRLERLLDKVKTSTKVMTEQVHMTYESVDLRGVIAAVERSYQPLAKSKGVNLKTIESPKPIFWHVDRPHVVTALSQLVENAIQATGEDGIVTVKLSASSDAVDIDVIDTGAGIAKEALPTLFDRFRSIGDIHDRKMGGLGLGLFIAKSLVTSHGGTITVESTLGEGTRMTIRLPKRTPSSTT